MTALREVIHRSHNKGRGWRHIREALLAYVFLSPALLIIGTFGLFPLVFSVYVSLHRWRIVRGNFVGLDQYIRAINNLAYILVFGLAIVFIYIAIQALRKLVSTAHEHEEVPWGWLVPSVTLTAALFQFVRFALFLLPEVLDIGEKVKGMQRTQALFLELLGEAWRVEQVHTARVSTFLILGVAIVLIYLVRRFVSRTPRAAFYTTSFTLALALLIIAGVMGWFTWSEINRAYAVALETGAELEIWSQVLTIAAGMFLLILSWKLWATAKKSTSTLSLVLKLLGASALMIGAWALVAELPRVVQAGDKNWWQGLQVTVYYSFFTVPVQLCLALFVAILLFQNIKAKGFFRLIYFLPYITSPVAAAGVFRVLFSGRPTAPLNSLLTLLGTRPLLWLNEPKGIFQMIIGPTFNLPQWLSGPSLALIVIVIFNIWNFFGYNAVVFLAGLGSIPTELYEAASIDGAGRAAQFRHITVPLLSPTIYFLTLIAVIGTFKAFTHVWVLRTGAALGTTDTASIIIFNEFNRNTRYGYASSLALVLMVVVLMLTLVNNRIAQEKVFYG